MASSIDKVYFSQTHQDNDPGTREPIRNRYDIERETEVAYSSLWNAFRQPIFLGSGRTICDYYEENGIFSRLRIILRIIEFKIWRSTNQ